jgi:hypothetical protein
MRVLRLVPAFVLFILVGSQVLLLADRAYATCCSCITGGPKYCYWCDGCYMRAKALLEELGGTEFTIETTKGGLRVAATDDVIKQLLDLREKGKIAYGTFTFQASGSENNVKLRCNGFIPIDPKMEELDKDLSNDPTLKKNIHEFEKTHPKKTSN